MNFNLTSSLFSIQNGNELIMVLSFTVKDRYNFNNGATDIATGALGAENGRFETMGWAKSFTTYGYAERRVTWKKGNLNTTKISLNLYEVTESTC